MPASVGSRFNEFLRRRLAWRRGVLLSLVMLLALSAASVDAQQLPVRTYTTADGLAHNNITRIVRDSQGFLWLCSPEGLSRFDGYVFRHFGREYGLAAGAVNDLLETADGDFWVATDYGLVHLDRWKRTMGQAPPEAEDDVVPVSAVIVPPGAYHSVTVLYRTRDETIWVGTPNGLFRLALGPVPSLQPIDIGLGNDFPQQHEVTTLLEDRERSLWLGTPVGLYRRWPDGSVERYTEGDPLPGHDVSDLLEDRDGSLWVATRKTGLFRLRTMPGHARPVVDVTISKANGLTTDWVTQLFQAADGRFWVATNEGLVELTSTEVDVHPGVPGYTAHSRLQVGYVGALGEDLGGNVWLGSSDKGALKLTPAGFVTYSVGEGIDGISDVFEDARGIVCMRGVVWKDADGTVPTVASGTANPATAITDESYGCFNGNRIDWFQPAALKLWGWVRDGVTLRTRNGEWWLGSEGGALRYAPLSDLRDLRTAIPIAIYDTNSGLPANLIFKLFEDSRGDVWISTYSSITFGLSRFERRTGRIHDMGNLPGLPSPVNDYVRSMVEDPFGNVWLGFDSGLARYSGGAIAFFTAKEGLSAGSIRGMHVDRSGRLWLASDGAGLIRVDNPSAPFPAFVTYTTSNGLSSNSLRTIVEDGHGYLYVGGGNGIDRLDTATGRVRHFTQADGLKPGLLIRGFRDARGVLWFGMTTGLARLDPAPEKPPIPPPIMISSLRLAGVPYRVSPLGEHQMTLQPLPPDDHQLEIDFVGLGFAPGEVLGYQYRLDDGSEWSPLTSRRSVTYASLSPGRHTFSVRAVNSDGMSSPVPATIAFTVLAPFWQRWWFIGLVALTLGLSGTLAYRYRVSRLLEVANMRTHIATDLHDDIGANLTRIALLSEVAQRTPEASSLVSIATLARESVGAMSDIVWAINPRREGLLDLTRRMRQHASELFTLRGTALRFDAPAGAETQRLGIDVRRDVLLIFKEAVNNAARHSGCSAVDITVRLERDRLVLSIIDDGVGFDPTQDADGQGLASMRRRASRINAVLRIERAAPSGTAVVLSVPIRT